MKYYLVVYLTALLFSIVAIAQEIPTKANTIIITLADSTQAHEKVIKVFTDKSYTLKKNKERSTVIFTEPKTLKNKSRINLKANIKGAEIIINGNIVVVGQGNMPIENKGVKGTPIFLAWEEMDKIAKSFEGKIKYEIR